MRFGMKVSLVFVLLTIGASTDAFGGEAFSQETGRRRHGPPPEAYTACEGKSAGDAAQFVNRRGKTVTGTCVQEGDRLVLRPDCTRRGSGGKTGGKQREARE